jgi:hypothetical protein
VWPATALPRLSSGTGAHPARSEEGSGISATIAERVARGAALLDEREPGWWQRIDLDRLYIGSTCDCVLGQLHGGSYVDGVQDLDLLYGTEDHGFMWHTRGVTDYDAEEAEANELEAEWRTLIEERRGDEPR